MSYAKIIFNVHFIRKNVIACYWFISLLIKRIWKIKSAITSGRYRIVVRTKVEQFNYGRKYEHYAIVYSKGTLKILSVIN